MTQEAFVDIPLSEVTLEARLAPGPGPRAPGSPGSLWIIGHPHPEYGGTMDNAVVLAARDAILAAGGGAVLRWNSRGVGRSSGDFGEGEGEARDLAQLLGRLARGRPSPGAAGTPALPGDLAEPFSFIGLAGYSFGAYVVLRALVHALASGASSPSAFPGAVMLFSPPLDFMSFEGLPPPGLPCLITLGDRDEFCRRSSLEAWLGSVTQGSRPRVEILRGVDHFYFGAERALGEAVRGFLSGLSPSP